MDQVICSPTRVSFHEKFFWYRRREAEAHVSRGAGLVCSGEPALVVPLTSLVSLTLSSRSALELELRLVNEIGHLVTLVFTFSSREDLTSWSVPLGRVLAPAIFVAMPKDIFPIITAFLDVSAWKALRSVSSGMRVVADKELPRMERLIAGAAWLAPSNFWTERSTVRIVADEGEKRNLPDANIIMKHPLFPSLTCFSSLCVGTTTRCYRTNDAEVPLRNQVSFPSFSEGFVGVQVLLNKCSDRSLVQSFSVFDFLPIELKCEILHKHASWAVMKAEDFEEDCLTSTESNKEFFTAFKLKTALVGEKIQKEYFGGFCAVLPPGSYKLVFFFVSPTKGTKVVHIPSAVSFVVTPCKSWESFKCLRCWAPTFNVNSKVSIEVAYEPQSSGQVLEVKALSPHIAAESVCTKVAPDRSVVTFQLQGPLESFRECQLVSSVLKCALCLITIPPIE